MQARARLCIDTQITRICTLTRPLFDILVWVTQELEQAQGKWREDDATTHRTGQLFKDFAPYFKMYAVWRKMCCLMLYKMIES